MVIIRKKRGTKSFTSLARAEMGKTLLNGVAASNERKGWIGQEGSVSSGFIGQQL